MDFETRAIHAGQEPDPATGAITTPIYQTSTYVQEALGEHKGYDYARIAQPDANRAPGVPRLARGRRARARLLVRPRRSDHAHAPRLAGRPRRRGQRRVRRHLPHVHAGLRAEGLPLHVRLARRDLDRARRASRRTTKFVWLETPTNPVLNIVDIAAAAEAAHAVGALVVVDNTFATPYLQQPLALGADVVLHSTTKYLGGHSDVVGGFVATNDDALAEQLAFLQNSLGAVPGPFDAWLVLRGLKTLAVRMDRHCANAARSPRSSSATRASSASSTRACRRTPATRSRRGRCGLRRDALVPPRGRGRGRRARRAHELWKLAESLGGVESLIEHPARMTHASTADAPFAVPPTLVRLSVGIESADDLIEDLESALAG